MAKQIRLLRSNLKRLSIKIVIWGGTLETKGMHVNDNLAKLMVYPHTAVYYATINDSKLAHYLRIQRHFHMVLPCKKSEMQENEGNIVPYRITFPL